jgi:hypothetical protein
MTFEALLAVFNKEHEFAILSLGGSGGISAARERELEHIIAINPSVVAVIDSEKRSPSDPLSPHRSEFTRVCDRLGIKWCVLERRAIENYLPERAIRAVKNSDKYRSLGHYEVLRAINPAWAKTENWRIARLTTKDDLKDTDLGTFLEKL